MKIFKETDFWVGDHAMSDQRLKFIDYSSIIDCPNWISLLGMVKTTKYSNLKILSVFDMNIWLLLIMSLILLSIINTKMNRNSNLITTIVISLINHLECLISKSGMFFINKVPLYKRYFKKKLSAHSITRTYLSRYMLITWVLASFLTSTLFSNEILMKLLFKSKIIIHSIDHLNEMIDFSALTFEAGYALLGIHVSCYQIRIRI